MGQAWNVQACVHVLSCKPPRDTVRSAAGWPSLLIGFGSRFLYLLSHRLRWEAKEGPGPPVKSALGAGVLSSEREKQEETTHVHPAAIC